MRWFRPHPTLLYRKPAAADKPIWPRVSKRLAVCETMVVGGTAENRRIWAVFQPHTYSRTKALLAEFAAAFDDADRVVVTAIYAAREQDDLGISANDLVEMMTYPEALHIADLSEAGATVSKKLEPGDVLITMGAGDVWRIGEEVLASLKHRAE